jgi:hypothetical protein
MAKNYDNELKDLYDTGTSDRQIDTAKLKQKELNAMLMKQAAQMAGPAENEDMKKRKMLEEMTKQMQAPAGMGNTAPMQPAMKKGGKVKAKCMASGGKVSQLAKANGIAVRGKSKGRII